MPARIDFDHSERPDIPVMTPRTIMVVQKRVVVRWYTYALSILSIVVGGYMITYGTYSSVKGLVDTWSHNDLGAEFTCPKRTTTTTTTFPPGAGAMERGVVKAPKHALGMRR